MPRLGDTGATLGMAEELFPSSVLALLSGVVATVASNRRVAE